MKIKCKILFTFTLIISAILVLLVAFITEKTHPIIADENLDFLYNNLSENIYNHKKESISETINSSIENINLMIQEYQLNEYIKEHSTKIRRFFEIYKAKMIGTEEIIVKTAIECNGDYKILIGIAGIESGLGRDAINGYNPFGYLDGKYYNSFEEAISKIGCAISRNFIAPCNKDLYCIVRRYGVPDTHVNHWLKNVQWFINQIH